MKAGPHAVGFTFAQKNLAESDEPLQPFTRDLDLQNMNGLPLIDRGDGDCGAVRGERGQVDILAGAKIFVCRPAAGKDDDCPQQSRFGRRWRGGLTVGRLRDADLESLLNFYQAGRN